ncbi:hypothetical protein J6590_046121 [Homalodisca vitripennis]|nr:hypothetical protein J6590_046121 [Homalodisca vitripennis]
MKRLAPLLPLFSIPMPAVWAVLFYASRGASPKLLFTPPIHAHVQPHIAARPSNITAVCFHGFNQTRSSTKGLLSTMRFNFRKRRTTIISMAKKIAPYDIKI